MFEEGQLFATIILGGGPAGLTAALYCARGSGGPPLVALGSMAQSQIFGSDAVENFPGIHSEEVSGETLIRTMATQAQRFGAILLEKSADLVDLSDRSSFRVQIGGKWVRGQSIIIATGAKAKWLGVPGEERLKYRGISACATCDGPLKVFRNQHLMVVGGGDSALEEALFLTKFASKITIVHRRNKLRASRILIDRVISNQKIQIKWDTVVIEFVGEDALDKVRLQNLATQTEEMLNVVGAFIAIGHEPATSIFKGQIDLDADGYVKVHNHVCTSVAGVFACGDCHDREFRQAITAAGNGCQAAIAAQRWLASNHAML